MDEMVIYRWVDRGECIHDIQRDCDDIRDRGWVLADKVRCAVDQFGQGNDEEIKALYKDLAQHTGLSVRSLGRLERTARAFPPDKRHTELTVTHHITVLGVNDEDERDYLLSEAVAHNMSTSRLEAFAYFDRSHRKQISDVPSKTDEEMQEILPGTDIVPFAEWVKPAPRSVLEYHSGVPTHVDLEDDEGTSAPGGYWVSPNGDRVDNIEKVLSNEGFYYVPSSDEPPFSNEAYYVESDAVDRPHVAHNSGNNEWYTPAEYIEAARKVMGNIDLDPASSDRANEIVQAEAYYTVEDDGLVRPWFGRVWMNPPYAKGLVDSFCNKLVHDYRNEHVIEAIVLVNNATETAWFRSLISIASAVVFPGSRVKFWKEDGDTGDPLQGQAIIYMGNKPQQFKSVYQSFGWSASL